MLRRPAGPHVNVGREPINWEERCQRLLEENNALKAVRNEQDQLIKDLSTKLRKLTRDFKALGGVATSAGPAGSTTSGKAWVPSAEVSPQPYEQQSTLLARLQAVTQQRDEAQRALAEIAARRSVSRGRRTPRARTPESGALSARTAATSPSRRGSPHKSPFRQETVNTYLAQQADAKSALRPRDGSRVGRSGKGDRERSQTPPGSAGAATFGGGALSARSSGAYSLTDILANANNAGSALGGGGAGASGSLSGGRKGQRRTSAGTGVYEQLFAPETAASSGRDAYGASGAEAAALRAQVQRLETEARTLRNEAAALRASSSAGYHPNGKSASDARSGGGSPSRRVNSVDNLAANSPQRQEQQQQRDQQLRRSSTDASAAEAQLLRSELTFVRERLNAEVSASEELRREVRRLENANNAAIAAAGRIGGNNDNDSNRGHLAPPSGGFDSEAERADPHTLLALQQSVNEKAAQVTVLASRFQHAQLQVTTLKQEYERVVEEIRRMHATTAELKGRIFTLEQEKGALQLRGERATELEALATSKGQELIRTEQELFRMVDRLQSCTRDTEMQVRRECSERFAELERMRDDADKSRRTKEREAFALQQELHDARREVAALRSDAEQYKKEATQLRGEKNELMERTALLGGKSLTIDDDVHKAVAMIALRKKSDEQVDVAKLWEGVEWNDGWEVSRMRDAVASAAFDLELAEQRCTTQQAALKERDELLRGISNERDALLNENIELRRRITGIQSTVARHALNSAAATSGGEGRESAASIRFAVRHISCDHDIQRLPDDTTFSPSLFLTLDGIEGYETAVGDTFFDVDADLTNVFTFEGLPVAQATLQRLHQSTFEFQLHQSYGLESEIVAAGTCSGAVLSRCRDGNEADATVELFGTNSKPIGSIQIGIALSHAFLPLLLDVDVSSSLTPERARAALVSLRTVRALRIQVFRCVGLSTARGIPCPYVFYAGRCKVLALGGIVGDTVVHSRGMAVTRDPEFDSVPRDHVIPVVDPQFVHAIHEGSVAFAVFDFNAKETRENLGVLDVPLRALLRSPHERIVIKEALHPEGCIEIGLSWVLQE